MELQPLLLLVILFVPLILLLFLGLPLAFTLGGVACLLLLILVGPASFSIVTGIAFAKGTSYILLAIPLFVLMANFLQHSGLADSLYEMMYRWMGKLPGGLAMGTVFICAIFAAMSGVTAAATITMGLIALPSMLNRSYDKNIAVGSISAGGALASLIPPSVVMIIYANFCEESVGRMFIGGMLPGLLLTGLFCIYILLRCLRNPKLGPSVPEFYSWKEKLITLRAVIFPIILVVAVLGSIYRGICTPTEAAAVGAVGALIIIASQRRLNWAVLKKTLASTVRVTGMVMWVLIGAVSFSSLYTLTGVTGWMLELLTGAELNRYIVLVFIQLTFFVLGCFLDPAGIIMICTPLFVPLITTLGFDKLWFGILFMINMEMGYITPPFGFNLFYMKSVVPPSVSMGDIYRSIWPFVVCQAICLALCIVFPDIILWLPSMMIT